MPDIPEWNCAHLSLSRHPCRKSTSVFWSLSGIVASDGLMKIKCIKEGYFVINVNKKVLGVAFDSRVQSGVNRERAESSNSHDVTDIPSCHLGALVAIRFRIIATSCFVIL